MRVYTHTRCGRLPGLVGAIEQGTPSQEKGNGRNKRLGEVVVVVGGGSSITMQQSQPRRLPPPLAAAHLHAASRFFFFFFWGSAAAASKSSAPATSLFLSLSLCALSLWLLLVFFGFDSSPTCCSLSFPSGGVSLSPRLLLLRRREIPLVYPLRPLASSSSFSFSEHLFSLGRASRGRGRRRSSLCRGTNVQRASSSSQRERRTALSSYAARFPLSHGGAAAQATYYTHYMESTTVDRQRLCVCSVH